MIYHTTMHGVQCSLYNVQCFNFLVFSNNSLFTIIIIIILRNAYCLLLKGIYRFFIIILAACIMPYICGLLLLIVSKLNFQHFHGCHCSGQFRLCCGFVFIVINLLILSFSQKLQFSVQHYVAVNSNSIIYEYKRSIWGVIPFIDRSFVCDSSNY